MMYDIQKNETLCRSGNKSICKGIKTNISVVYKLSIGKQAKLNYK